MRKIAPLRKTAACAGEENPRVRSRKEKSRIYLKQRGTADGAPSAAPSAREEKVMPKSCKLKKAVGLLALCFGAGIFLSFILPWRILAFVEAAALLGAGFLLLK